jgi:ribose transport system substrate-binding protein
MKKRTIFSVIAILLIAMTGGSAFAGGQKAATGEAKQRTFAIVYPLIHPVFDACTKSAQEEAAKQGVKLIIDGPTVVDVNMQIQIMENLIAQRVDGIAIGALEPTALVPVINQAVDQGIKVIAFDTDAPDSRRLGYIGTDHTQWGLDLGEEIGQRLNGKGKIIIQMGAVTALNLNQRLNGVRKTLAEKYPDIQILDVQSGDGDPNKTLAVVENLVESYPDFDAFAGMDGATGPAVAVAWRAKGLTKPVFCGDDTDDIVQAVRDGIITCTLAQHQSLWGATIIKELIDACDGKPVPELFDAGTTKVTRANVDQLYPKK